VSRFPCYHCKSNLHAIHTEITGFLLRITVMARSEPALVRMLLQLSSQDARFGLGGYMPKNKLTDYEARVIVHKGTEPPFSGAFVHHKEEGIYTCRRCEKPLFRSSDKFDSKTGWPSFDDAIPDAVKQIPDQDGTRTEIVCKACGAHLGHVFFGEGFTEPNTRHCVNSTSLTFAPKQKKEEVSRAIFASGCFWGTEHIFSKTKGVLKTTVGYTGGEVENPTYGQVCSGTTGHAEAIEVEYDPSITTYEELTRLFFETHDPTQIDRQGPDVGHQYRSAIFYLNEEQKGTATRLIRLLMSSGNGVATEVNPASTFWKAEEKHQRYYDKTGGTPYCHWYTKRF
jgi:peptide methionine sulfoxide reductase msrA/msrB